MSLTPPIASCPQSQCYEVVQICWADSQGAVSGCSVVPASVLVGNSQTVTLAELTPFILSIFGLMALAWSAKTLLRFIRTL